MYSTKILRCPVCGAESVVVGVRSVCDDPACSLYSPSAAPRIQRVRTEENTEQTARLAIAIDRLVAHLEGEREAKAR